MKLNVIPAIRTCKFVHLQVTHINILAQSITDQNVFEFLLSCADPEGWGLENHKAKGFLSITGMEHLENHEATKPTLKVGPIWARQRNAI